MKFASATPCNGIGQKLDHFGRVARLDDLGLSHLTRGGFGVWFGFGFGLSHPTHGLLRYPEHVGDLPLGHPFGRHRLGQREPILPGSIKLTTPRLAFSS